MNTQYIEADVVVVGAGIAGMIAATRAAQGGLKVTVLERSEEDRYMCNSRITSGVFHCALNSIQLAPNELQQKIAEATDGRADPDQARSIAHHALDCVRWLQTLGVRFVKGPMPYHDFTVAPPTLDPQNGGWRGRGGDVVLRTLEAELGRTGGVVLRGHRARSLSMKDDRCVGVEGKNGQGEFLVHAHATIIADGGFQTAPDLLREEITAAPEKLFQRNARTGFGDGLRMARAAGAAQSSLLGFYGHVLSKDAFTNDKLWPHLWLDFVAAAGLLVDTAGRRFTDEGLGGVSMANAIAAQQDPLAAFVIADQAIWDDQGRFGAQAPNPRLKNYGGTIYSGSSLQELARVSGIDASGLQATVSSYNEALRAGLLESLEPGRTTQRKYNAFPVQTAPFYAVPVCAGVTYTMGGILIDGEARVLNEKREVIPGLFAVGATTGGLEGGPKAGYVGGLVKSAVTGSRAAAVVIAEHAGRN